ncbi:MAG: YhcH/YjgK/YiaL family protein [Planctomycetia bacterium]|nr:YhcH/YjgK/YiaL family protein [Planctomycetia bacterium]
MYKTLFIILGLSMMQTAFGQTTCCSRQKESAREKPAYFASLEKTSLECPKLAAYPETVRKGIDFLKKTDLAALPLGRTDIDGDKVYVNKMEYTTSPVSDETVLESHRKYIDIQFVLEGEELIGVIPLTDEIPVTMEYDPEKEAAFYSVSAMPFLKTGAKTAGRLEVHAGDLAIFAPNDVHAPSLALGEPCKVVKLVVKCLIEE